VGELDSVVPVQAFISIQFVRFATKSAFACRAIARVFHAKADVSFQRSKRKNPLACELVGGKQASGF